MTSDDLVRHSCESLYDTYGSDGNVEDSDDPCPACRKRDSSDWYLWNGEHGFAIRTNHTEEEAMRQAFMAGRKGRRQ